MPATRAASGAALNAFAPFYRRRELPQSGKTGRHYALPLPFSSSRLRAFA